MAPTRLVFALLLAVVSAGAYADDNIQELFKKSQDADPLVRAKSARDLADLRTPDAAVVLVKMLADPHDHVHDEAVESLTTMSDAKVLEYLAEGAFRSARDPRTLAGLARVAADPEMKLVGAVPELLRALSQVREGAAVAVISALSTLAPEDAEVKEAIAGKLKSQDWETRAAALEAHAALAKAEASAALVEGCGDRQFQVRIAALEALAGADKPKALEQAKAMLSDEHWSVRVAAIQLIERAKDRTAVQLLVARLKEEDGRLKKDIGDCLRALASTEGQEGGGGDSVVTFYGIQIYSKRVIFVTDLSQGMKDKAAGTNKARIDIAQEQFVECLKGYPADGFFNLLVFATEVQPWQNRMQRAVPPAKSQSAEWLAKMVQAWLYARDTGRTNVYDSLALCFEDPNVDTVVFLSDATTITEGTYQNKTDILRRLLEKNRYRKIRFHMIGVGKKEKAVARSLMKDLAEETRGTFIETD